MSPRAYLTARPLSFGYSVPQRDGIAWMKAALERVAESQPVPDARKALRYYDLLARATTIGYRTSCLEDFTHQDWDRMRIFADAPSGDGQAAAGGSSRWFKAPLEARMAVFAETANALAQDAFAEDTEAPDLLVQVSCTGYDSPTAVQRLTVEKGWASSARLLHIGHMGCYAALPAVAMATDVVCAQVPSGDADADAHAALFLVEFCTLHHDPATTEVEQIVQQCLFADGAARLDVTAEPRTRSFAVLDYAESIIPDSLGGMTWGLADSSFRMTLSRDVPRHIQANLAHAVERFLGGHGLSVADVPFWAVHPGGPRVIESSAEALGLPDEAVRHSQQVLFERGNMSSTTLPHIWAAMAEDPSVQDGDLVVSIAFGPGLTVAMNLLRMTGG